MAKRVAGVECSPCLVIRLYVVAHALRIGMRVSEIATLHRSQAKRISRLRDHDFPAESTGYKSLELKGFRVFGSTKTGNSVPVCLRSPAARSSIALISTRGDAVPTAPRPVAVVRPSARATVARRTLLKPPRSRSGCGQRGRLPASCHAAGIALSDPASLPRRRDSKPSVASLAHFYALSAAHLPDDCAIGFGAKVQA